MSKRYQLVIAGGGVAGTVAAIAAGRCGLETLLIERGYKLGGSAVASLVTPMMSLLIENEVDHLAELDREIRSRLQGDQCSPWFNCEQLQLLLGEMICEAGVDLLLGVRVTDAEVRDGRIIALSGWGRQPERHRFEAECFLDCSGDAELAVAAGIPCQPAVGPAGRQAISLRFEMANVDVDLFCRWLLSQGADPRETDAGRLHCAHTWQRPGPLGPLFDQALANGELTTDDGRYFQLFSLPGKAYTLTLNCPEQCAVDSLCDRQVSRAVLEMQKSVRRLSRFLCQRVPGFAKACIGQIACAPGIRESRRIVGEYTLTAADVAGGRKFSDGVADCNWYMDIHAADTEVEPCGVSNQYYQIPYRTMFNRKISNLLVAGRCISADFPAQSSLRIQPVCRKLGEVAAQAIKKALTVYNGDVRVVSFV